MRLTILALCLLLLVTSPPKTQAGGCGFRGYGYSSYGHGGYGKSYWPGGYWRGSYYAPGYYSDSYNYYEEPIFVRYKVVVPLVDLPSYAIRYPEVAPVPTAPTASVTGKAATGFESKLDEILLLAKQTSSEIIQLKVRMEIVEGKVGVSKPAPGPAPSTAPSTTPTAPKEDDGPTVFYNRCATCHEAKVAQKLGKGLVLFVNTAEGPEMATLGPDGKPATLPLETLKKVEKELAGKTMPPERGNDGKPIPPMSDTDRKTALDFIRSVINSPLK